MNLLKLAVVPPITVTPDTTVLEAVEKMDSGNVGAVAIVNDDGVAGILTERDVVRRVTIRGRSPETTKVSEVMTSPVEVAHRDTDPSEALSRMTSRNYRHLPIVDGDNQIEGMLSLRHLLNRMVHDLSDELQALDAYIRADGPGG
jgi:CBS domain-containing protein